ncbi:PilN domain-containing protein [Pedobacter montanisoli]|uniref:PilN domain-containing protein n=1 Tax=Pedobacter montanisoli TaxID=2923277 RepID=A0ABS9ZZG4_9SPHI|nr:PilN domain-containing protein [Pedobacter montanisoli]MCJ0743677.1 PilN domain-containing protein [Pedobacter montanisoli]
MVEGLQTVLGVELYIQSDHTYSCRYCLLNRKGNEIHIQACKTLEGSLVNVIAALPKAYPIALVLTGKGLLHKNMQLTDDAPLVQLFQQAFPAIAPQQFYIQFFKQEAFGLLSIIRKEGVDELLDKLKLAGLKIYTVSLGAIHSVHIWPQLNLYGNSLHYDGHAFELDEKRNFIGYKIDQEARNSFPLKLGQEPITEKSVVAYAAAFQLLLHQKLQMVIADVASVNTAFIKEQFNTKLKQRALWFLMALFGLLLISFASLTHFNQQNEKLLQQVGAQTASADQLVLLKNNVGKNEQLLKELNWNGGYNYGWLLNEIGQSKPRQLTLNEIRINDFKTETEKQDKTPQIKITGVTNNLTAVNNWIFLLKEKKWVKTARLTSYQEDPEKEQYQFNFLITY